MQTHFDHYAVIGNPVSHSKSPLIHQLFAEQTQQKIKYEALLAPVDEFAQTVAAFRSAGGKGLSITLPFKEQAWQWVNVSSEAANQAGAVNTIIFRDNGIAFGDTTDGVGLLRDLTVNLNWQLQQQRLLIVGAGGAVRSVLPFILQQQPTLVVLTNRTLSKAQHLVNQFARFARHELHAVPATELADLQFDIVINGASTSLLQIQPDLPDTIFAPGAACYDMMYADKPTTFLQWAQHCGVTRTANGIGMVIEQAAEAFYLWRQVRPLTKPVIDLLKNY